MFYVAKCYWPGINEAELEAIAARATERSSRDAAHGAKYLGSLLFRDDELVLCLFEAPSPSAVKRASERAGIPCERVMNSIWLGPPPDTWEGTTAAAEPSNTDLKNRPIFPRRQR